MALNVASLGSLICPTAFSAVLVKCVSILFRCRVFLSKKCSCRTLLGICAARALARILERCKWPGCEATYSYENENKMFILLFLVLSGGKLLASRVRGSHPPPLPVEERSSKGVKNSLKMALSHLPPCAVFELRALAKRRNEG